MKMRRGSTSLPQNRGHSQTSLEAPPRDRLRSSRGMQDARIARRSRPPKIATTWQVSRCTHRCRLEWRFNQSKEYLWWSAQDRVSELPNVIERRKRVLRFGDDDGRDSAPPTSPGILGNAGQAPICESIQRQHAASCNDRGAVFSSTLKRDSCGFTRNTMREC